MGAAINSFANPCSILVSRHRFLPVKTTSDLLCLQSDSVEKTSHGQLRYRNLSSLPQISLGEHFQSVEEYRKRVQSVPSLRRLEKLTLNGDIKIKKNVRFEGVVHVEVDEGAVFILENQTLCNCYIHVQKNGDIEEYMIDDDE